MKDSGVIYLAIGLILIIDAYPLLFPFPQSRTYLDETPEGQVTITYNSKEQYLKNRTLPITSFTLAIAGATHLLIDNKEEMPLDA